MNYPDNRTLIRTKMDCPEVALLSGVHCIRTVMNRDGHSSGLTLGTNSILHWRRANKGHFFPFLRNFGELFYYFYIFVALF